MKRTLITFTLLVCLLSVCKAQFTVVIDEDSYSADLTVRISETSSFPDVTIKIGNDMSFEDFTIGITDKSNEADFIIQTSTSADFIIKASEDLSFPDISIKAGRSISFADINIEIRESGTVDYLIFSEKEHISINEMVLALLPALNKFLDYKSDKIPTFAPEFNKTSKNINSSDSEYIDIYATLQYAQIIAQDDKNTYLGQIGNESASQSIYNTSGDYGSTSSDSSIWSSYSDFGNSSGSYSAYNSSCSHPPVLIKFGQIVGYVTNNKSIDGGVSPDLLKVLRDKF